MSDLGAVLLGDGTSLADISGAVSGLTVSWAANTVAELRVELVDRNRALADHSLLALGTSVQWAGGAWEVGSVERTYAAWGLALAVGCRSALAKALRLAADRTRTDRNCTPQSWITRRVAELGGSAVVEAGASRRTIVQRRGQSVLDVMAALASDTETEWVEFDGTIYVGTAWWAFQGGPGLPMWSVSWLGGGVEAVALSGAVSADDLTQGASASVTVPWELGSQVRPWHRLHLSGAGEPLDGAWLVGDVSLDVLGESPVVLSLSRPLQSAPKVGSAPKRSGSGGSGSSGGGGKASAGSASGSSGAGAGSSGGSAGASKPVSRRRTSSGTVSKGPASSRPSASKPVSRTPTTYAPGTARPWSRGTPGGSNGGTALDVGMPLWTPLYAARSGVVLACRFDVRNHASGGSPYSWPAAANFVLLGIQFQGRPAKLLYWHLSPRATVRTGQRVHVGQLVGYSGNTGHSTGPHTHFQASWGHGTNGFGGAIIFPPSRVWA